MKLNFILVLFLSIGMISWQTKHQTLNNLNTFKTIPDDMYGAGESFYLSAKDKEQEKFICTTNYETALIYIDRKPIRLQTKNISIFSKNKQSFTNKEYTLIIIEGPSKQVGDENYTMKGTLILIHNSNIVWKKNVIGEGGD